MSLRLNIVSGITPNCQNAKRQFTVVPVAGKLWMLRRFGGLDQVTSSDGRGVVTAWYDHSVKYVAIRVARG
jgi:hypothetical protein